MNTREKYTVVLICLGLILAFLPITGNRSLTVKPSEVLREALDESSYFTVDQVARFVVTEDSSVRFIDLRPQEEFRSFSIPGSVNIPYEEFIHKEPESYLVSGETKNIFYSNSDLVSNYAFIMARGMNFRNVYVMKGGMNEWFDKIMNSRFSGDKITARENALFETRSRAKALFTELNSLPDSLKQKLIESKHLAAKKLDGGCE